MPFFCRKLPVIAAAFMEQWYEVAPVAVECSRSLVVGRRRADWEGQASRIYSKCYPFFGRSSQNHAVLEVKLVLEGKHGETTVLQLCFGWFWWVYR